MIYTPPVHLGSQSEVVTGLLDEAENIVSDGLMRLHAKCRELDRIRRQLATFGVDLLEGCNGADAGWYLAVKDHRSGCPVDTGGECACEPFRRIRSL